MYFFIRIKWLKSFAFPLTAVISSSREGKFVFLDSSQSDATCFGSSTSTHSSPLTAKCTKYYTSRFLLSPTHFFSPPSVVFKIKHVKDYKDTFLMLRYTPDTLRWNKLFLFAVRGTHSSQAPISGRTFVLLLSSRGPTASAALNIVFSAK